MKSTLCLLMALVCNVAWAQVTTIQSSNSVEDLEYVYALKSAANHWMTSYTSPTDTEANRGVFAFFADGENAYKVFSIERQKWVSYTKATSYSDGANKAILVDTQGEANAWNITYVDGYFQIAPYKSDGTAAATYWNWNGGIGANANALDNTNKTIGLYNKGAVAGNNGDNGSRWILVEVSDFDIEQVEDLSVLLTDQGGNEYSSTFKGIAGKTKPVFVFSGAAGYTCSDGVWDETTYKATINFPFPVSGAEVLNPTMIVSGASWSTTSRKWRAVTESDVDYVKVQTSTVAVADAPQWLWAIYPELNANGEFTFKIKNIAKGTYVCANPEATGSNDDVVASTTKPVRLAAEGTSFSYVVRTGNNRHFAYKNNAGNSIALSIASSSNSNAYLGVYTGSHNGNDVCTADPVTNTNFGFPISTEGNEQGVFISPFENTAIKYYVNGTNVNATRNAANSENFVWAIYPTLRENGFTYAIKNIGAGGYIRTESTTRDHSEDLVTISTLETATQFTLSANNKFKTQHKWGEKDLFLSSGSSTATDQFAGTWDDSGHNGIKNTISTVPIGENTYTLTDAVGNVYTGTYNGYVGISDPAFAGVEYTLTNKVWNGNALTANIEFSGLPFPISKAGEENWTFIRCYMSSLETFFYTNGDNVKTKSADSRNNKLYLPTNNIDEVKKYQWAIYPTLTDGKFTFKLKNFAANKYVIGTGSANSMSVGEENAAATFCWGQAMGSGNGFYLNSATNVFFAGSSSSQGEKDAALWTKSGTTHMGANLSFVKAAFSITFDATGCTTLYTPGAVTIPDGVSAYSASLSANKTILILHKLSGTIPANTAVLLKGTASTTYVFSAANDVAALTGNILVGATTNNPIDGSLILNASDETFVSGDVVAYQAYLTLSEGSAEVFSLLNEEDLIDSAEDFVQGGVYTFVSSKGWAGATETCTNVISTAKAAHNVTGSAADAMFQWTVYKSNNGNYYLYNIGKQMFMGVQANNNSSVPFVEYPAGKNLTFKKGNVKDYPIMFSTNNAAVVNHNGSYGDGCISWTGGWNNLTDAGNAHQVTLVKTLTNAELQAIADIVEAYDKRLYVRAEVEGSWANNPNTHFGSVTATTSASTTLKTTLKTTPAVSTIDYVGTETTTIDFTRAYRGFEFQGYSFGGVDLGKSFTLTDDLKSSITEQNPLVAKFAATDEVTLFYDDDEFSYRIPAIATTSTGRLIAVSDYRHSLDDIGRYNFGTATPGIDLVIRTSDDNGKTWSDTTIIAKGSGVLGADDCAYGDAAIAVVGQKVLVMGAAGDVMFGDGSATAHNRTVRIFSEDNGVTWTAPQDISETFFINANATINSAYSLFFGSGKLAVDTTSIGTPEQPRIYGAVLVKNQNTNNGIFVVYTDDLGLTWSILGGSQTHITANDEPKVEILPSGQILLSVRRGGGRQFNVFTYGTGENDKANGVGTWNGNVNGCSNGGSNTCNGEIFLLDAKKADGTAVKLLLQSQPKGGSGLYDRRDVTIWYKEVDNTSYTSSQIAGNWTQGMQVSTQQSAYSTMSLQEDGKIAFFFEEAPCYGDDQAKGYCMVYLPLTIEEITKNKYFSPDADFTTERNISVVLTDAQGNEYRDQFESTLPGVATTLEGKYPFITLGDNANFEEVGEAYTYTNTVTLPFKVSNNETTVWYNIYFPINTNENNYPAYMSAAENSDVVKIVTESAVYGNSTLNTFENVGKINWAIYQSEDEDFAFILKNKSNDQYLKTTSDAPEGTGNDNVRFTASIDDAASFLPSTEGHDQSYQGEYSLKIANGYVCVWSVSNGYVTYSQKKSHKGAWVKFVEAPDFEALFASINSAIASVEENYVNAGLFGTHLGQYHLADDLTLETIRTAMENPDEVKLNVLIDYKEKLNAPQLNTPKAGQFFRVAYDYGGNAGKLYMQSTASSVKGLEFTAATDAASIWVYYDGALYSYTAGQCLRETGDDRGLQAVGGKTTATFSASTRAKGKYNLQCDSYVHANANSGKYYTDHCSSNNCVQHDLILEEVTELPFTISSVGYGTLWAPVALEIPDHVKAYTGVLNAVENVLELTKIATGIIPAGTGVVIYRDDEEYIGDVSTGTTHDFAITSTTDTLKSKFSGSVAKINAGANAYTLQLDNSGSIGVAFKPSAATIPGFKAYFELPSQQQAQALRIRFASTTEIETPMANGQQPTTIYDLQGRRIENPTKGVYIVNGKKVVIK